MDALKTIAQDSMKSEIPAFGIGDTVKVHVKITEGDKSRIQIFEGTVIAKKHCKEARRYQRDFHCKTCSTRLRYRESFPRTFSVR